jgi:hypothetical protein
VSTSASPSAPRRAGGELRARRALWAGAALALAAAVVLLSAEPGRFHALADVLRGAAAALVLFAVGGYAPARLLAPERLRESMPLLVLPTGAAVSGLAFTLPGVIGVPLPVSLVALLGLGLGGAVTVRRRLGPIAFPRGRAATFEVVVPAALAILVAFVLFLPLIGQGGPLGVVGGNGDAWVAAGTGELLRHAPPGAERVHLPLDHVFQPWESKLPIYYVLSATSALSGLDSAQTFETVIALVAGLTVIGYFLVARHLLGVSARAAVVGAAFVALDRFLLRLGWDPFYNQLWAVFSLPLVLLFTWLFIRHPDRGTLVLAAAFSLLATLAYPLLAPFPALFVVVAAVWTWREARSQGRSPGWIAALRLPRGRRALWIWVPLGLVAAPVVALLLAAAADKGIAAFRAALPGGDLAAWGGKLLALPPAGEYFGLPRALTVLLVVVLALVLVTLRRCRRDAAVPLGATLLGLLLAAGWFTARGGDLFVFRALGFLGITSALVAGVGAGLLVTDAERRPRLLGRAATCVIVLASLAGVYKLLHRASPTVTPAVYEVRSWGKDLPRTASVRIDVGAIVLQQWSGYMLGDRPLSDSHPLLFFFPHPPVSRRADYLIADSHAPRPVDAAGGAIERNERFALYRARRGVPGPDYSSRRLVDPFRRETCSPVGGNPLPRAC